MLKPYDKPDDIPEALREHYSRREDGKYHADIPNDHPAVKHNATLLSEKQTAEEKARKAEADLESAKASSLPRGHKPVPNADADLLAAIKAAGVETVEAFNVMKTEHGTFKAESEAAKREKHLDAVRRAEGWGEGAVSVLSLIQDLPEIELRDTDEKDDKGVPKKKAVAKVKGADNVVTEKDFSVYFAEKHGALLPALTVSKEPDGTPLPSHGASGGSAEKSFAAPLIQNRYGHNAPQPAAAK